MYYDEKEDRYYSSRRDYEKVSLYTRLQRGDLRTIEGFSRYTIADDGSVINIQRARVVKPHMNSTGRLSIGLVNDEGTQKTLGLARLICYHFHAKPGDDEQYFDVVHKDDDLRNVHPSNLLWVARWKRHANPENYNVDIS